MSYFLIAVFAFWLGYWFRPKRNPQITEDMNQKIDKYFKNLE